MPDIVLPTGRPAVRVPGARLGSIDIIRGAVIVLMAIDHVRVYSGLPAGGPTAGIFFTRWVTHFCAPGFLFLAGTSAYLAGLRRTSGQLSSWLFTRGAWLVLLELTVIRAGWTFNADYAHYVLLGVIWAIGCCMILMAGIVRLPVRAVGALGLVVVAGHNLVDPFLPQVLPAVQASHLALAWQVIYFGPILGDVGGRVAVLYSIVPWVGVMAVGYWFGTVMMAAEARRRRLCVEIGLGAVALFLVLRGLNLYGDPRPWAGTVFSFLSTAKYPASLSFLLMTLGPTIALLPALEGAHGRLPRVLSVFGRVPFFFYLLHIPLIHLLAIAVSQVRLGHVSWWLFANHPMGQPPPPPGYTWSLSLLYAVWALAVLALYVPCRWFADVKSRRQSAWLQYL